MIHGTIKPLFGTPLNRSHWASQGLVAQYLMNEMGGDLIHDSCGMNDGKTILMAPMSDISGWVPGPHGAALAFDGGSDGVTIPKIPGVAWNLKYTMIVTFIPRNFTIAGCLVSQYDTVTPSRNVIAISNDGSLNAGYYTAGTGYCRDGYAPLIINKEYTAALVNYSTVDWPLLYLNGRLTYSSFTNQSFCTNNTIGAGDFGAKWFAGLISSVEIYNRALSAEEIAYLYVFPWCMYDRAVPAWMMGGNKVPVFQHYYNQMRAA